MKLCVLHIGLQKTGSSSIQAFLLRNGVPLDRHGFHYPQWSAYTDFPERGFSFHNSLAAYVADIPLPFPKPTADDIAKFVAGIMADERVPIISGEALSRLRRPERFTRLLPGFDFRVILYLREQSKWLESLYNQRNQLLLYRDCEKILDPEILSYSRLFQFAKQQKYWRRMNFSLTIERWATAVGAENIAVRVFDPREFAGGNLYDDFLAALGIASSAGFTPQAPLNESISNRVFELLLAIDRRMGRRAAIGAAAALRSLRTRGIMNLSGPYSILSQQQRRDLMARYAEANSQIARRYLHRASLFPPQTGDAGAEFLPVPGSGA